MTRDTYITLIRGYYWDLYEMFFKAGGDMLTDDGVQVILQKARALTCENALNSAISVRDWDMYFNPDHAAPWDKWFPATKAKIRAEIAEITEDEIF